MARPTGVGSMTVPMYSVDSLRELRSKIRVGEMFEFPTGLLKPGRNHGIKGSAMVKIIKKHTFGCETEYTVGCFKRKGFLSYTDLLLRDKRLGCSYVDE